MIVRYGIECPGCHSKIVLRLSIGWDIEQPFFAICKACKAILKGKQIIWYEPEPGFKLEMETGGEIEPPEESPDVQSINLHPDLPSVRTAPNMWTLGGSPFIHQNHLLGDNFGEAYKRMKIYYELIRAEGPALRRFGHYYLDHNWPLFCAEGKRICEDNWPEVTEEPQYHDIFPRVVQLTFLPIMVQDWHLKFVTEWNSYTVSNLNNLYALRAYSASLNATGEIVDLQRQVFSRLEFFIENHGAYLAALPAEFYPGGMDAAVADLTLPRDDFDKLKGQYVDCYELAHKVLAVIVGVINVIERGHENRFDQSVAAALSSQGIKGFGSISTQANFKKKSNGPKRAYLKSLTNCEAMWNDLLDRELRNAVGHFSARHDLHTGMILVDGNPRFSYLEFTMKTMRMATVLMCLLHVLKMAHMHRYLIPESAT